MSKQLNIEAWLDYPVDGRVEVRVTVGKGKSDYDKRGSFFLKAKEWKVLKLALTEARGFLEVTELDDTDKYMMELEDWSTQAPSLGEEEMTKPVAEWPNPNDPVSIRLFEQQIDIDIIQRRSLSNQKLALMGVLFSIFAALLAGAALLETLG